MSDEPILQLQDFLLGLSKSEDNRIYEYSFEEIEAQDTDPKIIITRYYETNYFQQESDYYFTLAEMLVSLEKLDDWRSEVQMIAEKYRLRSEFDEVLYLLHHLFKESSLVWRVSPELPRAERGHGEQFEPDEVRFPPIDTNWQGMLFRSGERYFLLHFSCID